MVKQDSRVDPPLEGESRPGDGARAPELEAIADRVPRTEAALPEAASTQAASTELAPIDVPGNDAPDAEAAATRAPRKPRTRKPRPTYDDGALTRLFKFPSKTYPRSTYYVTGDEIIIRIKKARKKWKLVIPKKRVVSYKTNRWFAKPRWIELELTVTQATRLGLVETRAPSKVAADEAAPDGLAVDQPMADEGGNSAEDTDAGLDGTDGGGGDAGPEVSLIDESDISAEAEGGEANEDGGTASDDSDEFADEYDETVWADETVDDVVGAEPEAGNEREAVSSPTARTDGAAIDLSATVKTGTTETADTDPGDDGAASPAAFAALPVAPEPAPEHAPQIVADCSPVRGPVVVHVASSGVETAQAEDATETVVDQTGPEPTLTVAASEDPASLAPAALTVPASNAFSEHIEPRDVGRHKPARRIVALLAVFVLIAGSAVMWSGRDDSVSGRFAEADSAVEQANAPAILIETGSIVSHDATRVPGPDPRPVAEGDPPSTPVVSAALDTDGPEIAESAIEPMERKPEWPQQAALTASSREPHSESVPETSNGVESPRWPDPPAVLLPPKMPASPVAVATPTEPPRPKVALADGCRELEAAARLIRVQFDYASASPQDLALASLDAVAKRLGACGTGRVTIEGHADADGDADRNQALSVRRAQAVWEYLVKAGANPARLSVIGYGHSRPDVPNVTPENKHKNRRAILVVETAR